MSTTTVRTKTQKSKRASHDVEAVAREILSGTPCAVPGMRSLLPQWLPGGVWTVETPKLLGGASVAFSRDLGGYTGAINSDIVTQPVELRAILAWMIANVALRRDEPPIREVPTRDVRARYEEEKRLARAILMPREAFLRRHVEGEGVATLALSFDVSEDDVIDRFTDLGWAVTRKAAAVVS
jgi:hypothetical protein